MPSMIPKHDIYELTLPRGSAGKLAAIAERKGYQDDCQYLIDFVVKHIEDECFNENSI